MIFVVSWFQFRGAWQRFVNNLPNGLAQLAQDHYMKVEWPGVEPVTCRSQVQRSAHYTTVPQTESLVTTGQICSLECASA